MKPKQPPPVHPGEILQEEFLAPHALSQNALARALGVPPRRINEIVLGQRGITADTALRLSRFFGTTAEFWLNLQSGYELRLARHASASEIKSHIRPWAGLQAA